MMKIMKINICSNYNTPSFGVSLKKPQTKNVVANDIAKKALVVSATTCLALVTGKANKNDNRQDKPVKIGNDELYIDSDGHLTQTPPNERTDGYYILGKDGTSIYKTPNGKLMIPKDVKAEPKMAVDVLKADIMNADTENLSVEAEIESLDKYIGDIKKYTEEEDSSLQQKLQILDSHIDILRERSSLLEQISDDDFYKICLANATHTQDWYFRGYYKNYLKFSYIGIHKQIFRTQDLNEILDKEAVFKPFERPNISSEKNNSQIDNSLDSNSDIASLLGILEQKRSTLSANKNKLKNKRNETTKTETACSEKLKNYCKKINDKRKWWLSIEEDTKYYPDIFNKKCENAHYKANVAWDNLYYKIAADKYFMDADRRYLGSESYEFTRLTRLKEMVAKYLDDGGDRDKGKGRIYNTYKEAFDKLILEETISDADIEKMLRGYRREYLDYRWEEEHRPKYTGSSSERDNSGSCNTVVGMNDYGHPYHHDLDGSVIVEL